MTAPVFVAAAHGSTTFSTTGTLALNVGSAAGRCVLVLASNNSSVSTTIASATYAGVAMTAHTSAFEVGGNPYRGFYLYNVSATGSNNVIVTYGDGNGKPYILAACFSGVDTTAGVSGSTNASAFSAAPSWSITSATGDLGVSLSALSTGTNADPAGGTGVTQDAFDRSGTEFYDSFVWQKAGASSLTIAGTTGTPTPNWFGVAFSLKAIAGASGGLFRTNPGGNLSGLGSSGPFFQNPLQ